MIKENINGFTLVELTTIIIIVGILASLIFPMYQKTKSRTRDAEARTAVRLLQAAQKAYYMKNGGYVNSNSITVINSALKLDLSAGYWDYTVGNPGATFISAHSASTGKTWEIQDLNSTPCCSSGCDSGDPICI